MRPFLEPRDQPLQPSSRLLLLLFWGLFLFRWSSEPELDLINQIRSSHVLNVPSFYRFMFCIQTTTWSILFIIITMGMSLGIATPLNFSPISSDSSNGKIHTGKFWVSGQDDIDLLSFFNFIDPFSFFIVEIVCSIRWYICYDTFCFCYYIYIFLFIYFFIFIYIRKKTTLSTTP